MTLTLSKNWQQNQSAQCEQIKIFLKETSSETDTALQDLNFNEKPKLMDPLLVQVQSS